MLPPDVVTVGDPVVDAAATGELMITTPEPPAPLVPGLPAPPPPPPVFTVPEFAVAAAAPIVQAISDESRSSAKNGTHYDDLTVVHIRDFLIEPD